MFDRLCLLVLLSTPLLASAQTQQAPAGGMRGRITDSVTGRPIAAAEVHVLRGRRIEHTTQSDTAGVFTFENVPEGIYSGPDCSESMIKVLPCRCRN